MRDDIINYIMKKINHYKKYMKCFAKQPEGLFKFNNSLCYG